jgi:hypothetical protein
MTSRTDRSIPELFSDAFGQLAKLIGNEFAVARAELSEKAGQAGRSAAMMGAGAVVMIPALVMLLFAAAAALMHGGINRLSGDALKPTATIDEIQRDKAAAREMVR